MGRRKEAFMRMMRAFGMSGGMVLVLLGAMGADTTQPSTQQADKDAEMAAIVKSVPLEFYPHNGEKRADAAVRIKKLQDWARKNIAGKQIEVNGTKRSD